MQSEITKIEDVWNFDEIQEKKKLQNIFNNMLNEYTKTHIYDVIFHKYGIIDIWIYFILESKFWENRITQIVIICIIILLFIRFK